MQRINEDDNNITKLMKRKTLDILERIVDFLISYLAFLPYVLLRKNKYKLIRIISILLTTVWTPSVGLVCAALTLFCVIIIVSIEA
jgi:hypothetical protein